EDEHLDRAYGSHGELLVGGALDTRRRVEGRSVPAIEASEEIIIGIVAAWLVSVRTHRARFAATHHRLAPAARSVERHEAAGRRAHCGLRSPIARNTLGGSRAGSGMPPARAVRSSHSTPAFLITSASPCRASPKASHATSSPSHGSWPTTAVVPPR